MKKFLFCGFGNIMQRHFMNLKELLPDCKTTVYTNKHTMYRVFDDNLNISHYESLLHAYDIDYICYNINDALDDDVNYDAVFIGTLPPERIDIAIKVAEKGNNLFIEKPLSNNLDKIYKLQ